MTTDNRTNEPTPEQVEAAAKAIWATRYPDSRPDIAEETWAEISGYGAWTPEALDIMTEARAALVAAQGAAPPVNSFGTSAERVKNGADSLHVEPQAESDTTGQLLASEANAAHLRRGIEELSAPVLPSSTAPQAEAYVHCCNHTKCPGGSLCCCASEQRLRDCWNQWREEVAGDTKQAFRDAYSAGRNDPAPWAVAPVLPSSGVDEAALAEVIGKVTDSWDEPLDEVHDIPQIARAVAAWLKVQGGESRGRSN